MTPLASPCNKEVGAHENKNRETATFRPGLKPLVEATETTSSASSPLEAVFMTVLSTMTPQVLLLQPGFGDEKQSPQLLALASEH